MWEANVYGLQANQLWTVINVDECQNLHNQLEEPIFSWFQSMGEKGRSVKCLRR